MEEDTKTKIKQEEKTQMSTKEETDKVTKLKDGNNYHGWLRQLKNHLDGQDLLANDGTLLTDSDDKKQIKLEKKQRIAVTAAIHPDLLEDISDDIVEAQDILSHLKAIFGSVNHLTYLSKLKNLKQSGIDPGPYITLFDKTFAKFRNAGGKMDYSMVTLFLLEGLDPWYAPFSGVQTTKMRTQTVDKSFFDATRNGILVHYADTPHPSGRAMAATQGEKKCSICEEMGRSDRAIHSHNTEAHRDFPPKINKNKQKGAENKEGKNYALFTSTETKSSTPVWDPAANGHFWTTKPTKNYRAKSGKVNVATGQSADIIGEGESKLGAVNLENIHHVPTFSNNPKP